MVLFIVEKVSYQWTCAKNYRFLHLYICIRYKSSLFRLCDSEFGITPVDDITIGITWTAFCFHTAHISFASSWYFFCLSVIVLARICVFGTAMSIKNEFFAFLFMKVMSGRLNSIVLSVKYAAVPVQLEIVIFQNTGWCVLVVWTFVFNQFSWFCQFLMDNFG